MCSLMVHQLTLVFGNDAPMGREASLFLPSNPAGKGWTRLQEKNLRIAMAAGGSAW